MTASPLAQLRSFIIDDLSDDIRAFVDENFEELGPDVRWGANLKNQARDFTKAVIDHDRLDDLWPALRSQLPQSVDEIDRLAALDWAARPRIADSVNELDTKWLLGGAAAVVVAIVIGVLALTGSPSSDAPATTLAATQPPQPTVTETLPPTSAVTVTEAPAEPVIAGPPLDVSSIKAFNGDVAAEQSAIQLLVTNPGDVAVNVDRVSFTIKRTGATNCTILPPTGSDGGFFARGADLGAYSVPIYEYNISDNAGSLTLNPPRRFEADGEETLLLFDLDNTREAPEDGTLPPYVDERSFLDDAEVIGFTVFEIEVALETTKGETVDAGTVVVAHPRLIAGLVIADEISSTCRWGDVDVSSDAADLLSMKLQDNLAELAQFCDAPVVRGSIGGNDHMDALLRDVVGCS